jgi:hypothetical protein
MGSEKRFLYTTYKYYCYERIQMQEMMLRETERGQRGTERENERKDRTLESRMPFTVELEEVIPSSLIMIKISNVVV